VQPHLLAFQGERQVEHCIAIQPRRTATAWLSEQVMMGGEDAGRTRNVSGQYHPFTLHWRTPGREIGWVRLLSAEPVDARVTKGQAEIAGQGPLIFQVYAPASDPTNFNPFAWQAAGLSLQVETNAGLFEKSAGQSGYFELTYSAEKEENLWIKLKV
jgi:hypothetical protein